MEQRGIMSTYNRGEYRFRSDCISFRGKSWDLYLNEVCMKDKERRIMFNLAGWGKVCYIVCGYGSGLESAENFCTDDLYATHNL